MDGRKIDAFSSGSDKRSFEMRAEVDRRVRWEEVLDVVGGLHGAEKVVVLLWSGLRCIH
jgi:hypothetical protein